MCHRKQLSIVQLQNFTNVCSFRMYLMHLNIVHTLKCETNLTLFPLNPTSTFRNGDVLGPLSESLPLNLIATSVQVTSVSVSNGSVNSLSTCKMKSILLFTVR